MALEIKEGMTRWENISYRHLKKTCHIKYTNYNGELIKVYDTVKKVLLDRILNDYYIHTDLNNMLWTIEKTRGSNKRSADMFLDILYWIDQIRKYQNIDHIY